MTTAITAASTAMDVGDRSNLCRVLAQIDESGWDSPIGEAVLQYARDHVVRPLLARAELTGGRAADAQGAAWVVAWRTLSRPDLRHQASPWGVVTAAVRREIAAEQVATAYRTNPRSAYRLARLYRMHVGNRVVASSAASGAASAFDDLGSDADWLGGLPPPLSECPLSLDRLTARGWDPPHSPSDIGKVDLGRRLNQVVDALAEVGWPSDVAANCVAWLTTAGAIASESKSAETAELPGWRELSAQTGIPAWQTRRLAALLLGRRGQPGLLARMVHDGDSVLHQPETQRLVRSTVRRWMSSPCAATTSTPTVRAADTPSAA